LDIGLLQDVDPPTTHSNHINSKKGARHITHTLCKKLPIAVLKSVLVLTGQRSALCKQSMSSHGLSAKLPIEQTPFKFTQADANSHKSASSPYSAPAYLSVKEVYTASFVTPEVRKIF